MATRTSFVINNDDIHLDDHIARIRLKAFFQAEQKRNMEYDRDVAKRVGRGNNWVHSTWRQEQWLLETMQLMARAFNYELTFRPEMAHDVWLRMDKVGMWHLSELYATNPDTSQRDEAARIDLCRIAGKIREAQGIEPVDFAKRIGTDTSKLLDWEDGNRPHYTMTFVQRHFRFLGAPLKFFLSGTLDGAVGSFELPVCKEEGPAAAAWLMRNEVNVVESNDEVMIFNSMRPQEVVRFPLAAWQGWIRA